MTGAERAAIAAEVGLYLLQLQQRYHPTTPTRRARLRAVAVGRVAAQRQRDHTAVSALFDAFGGDGAVPAPQGRRPAYANSAAAQADMLAQLLVWAFKRLPAPLRPNSPPNRLAAAVDALALKAAHADKSDLSRLRNGKRRPISARAASDKTALTLSLPLLGHMLTGADKHIKELTKRHRAIITPVRLRGAAFRLLRLASALAQRKRAAEAAARRLTNFSN